MKPLQCCVEPFQAQAFKRTGLDWTLFNASKNVIHLFEGCELFEAQKTQPAFTSFNLTMEPP